MSTKRRSGSTAGRSAVGEANQQPVGTSTADRVGSGYNVAQNPAIEHPTLRFGVSTKRTE
jgi:hypothetical protein